MYLGLRPIAKPDEDSLLQCALALSEKHQQLRGVNMGYKSQKRSIEEVERLRQSCFEVGYLAVTSLSIPISTKIHRLMRHIGDQIIQFGSLRHGETDENETMHKTTKSVYAATNKKLSLMGKQLVQVRPISQAFPHSVGNGFNQHYIEEILNGSNSQEFQAGYRTKFAEEIVNNKENEDFAKLSERASSLLQNTACENVTATLEGYRHEHFNITIWSRLSSYRLLCKFPWIDLGEIDILTPSIHEIKSKIQ